MNHETYKTLYRTRQKATGKTYPNPLVGAVIVHNDVIIGEGFHQKAGEAHAEINAINSVKNPELLPRVYDLCFLGTLCTFGKTPPCSLKLKEIGFKESSDWCNGQP